jgi:hypothetical protein
LIASYSHLLSFASLLVWWFKIEKRRRREEAMDPRFWDFGAIIDRL